MQEGLFNIPLKLVAHMLPRPGSPHDPIGPDVAVKGAMHRVFAQRSHHNPHWSDQQIINEPEYDLCIDCSENMTNLHPPRMNLSQALRSDPPENHEQPTENQGP